MKRFFLLALVAVLIGAAAWIWRHPLSHTHLVQREFLAMGTRISVSVRVDPGRSDAEAQTGIDAVKASMLDFGKRWWAWGPRCASEARGGPKRPAMEPRFSSRRLARRSGRAGISDSSSSPATDGCADIRLADINYELSLGHAAAIPPAMQPLFTRAWQLHLASEGRFEPRIGALVRLWGFDDIARLRSSPPAESEINTALAHLRAAPAYEGGAQYGPAPGVSWDFGAIAKGFVVDAALDQLSAAGFSDALVDAGGNLAVRGTLGARPWHIAIHNPRAAAGKDFLAELDAADESVNTHADDQRFFEADGHRYGHILDPATGWPAHGLNSVTVVHRDGALADAGGLALLVAGRDGWRPLARLLELDQVLVVDEDGHAYATEKLSRRLQPESGVKLNVVP